MNLSNLVKVKHVNNEQAERQADSIVSALRADPAGRLLLVALGWSVVAVVVSTITLIVVIVNHV